jgi:Fe-S oxidoreductase
MALSSTRPPIDWRSEDFWDEQSLRGELERVFDYCDSCRICWTLCEAFPVLFDLVDSARPSLSLDDVDRADFGKVAEQCYLCDLCYETYCPYVPPFEAGIDFPHLMLRAKAQRYKKAGPTIRDRVLTSTDAVGKLATIPLVNLTVNALNKTGVFRTALSAVLGVHEDAPVPTYYSPTLRQQFDSSATTVTPLGRTTGKVALYATCYGNYNAADLGADIVKVFEHNGIQINLVPTEACCGMPKLDLGDLDGVDRLKRANIGVLARLVDQGYDLIAPVPSCVLMYKQELPLMYPDDAEVAKVADAFFDPFEYLGLRHDEGGLKLDFNVPLGDVSYQVACHLRVQNIGLKAKELLDLVPETRVHAFLECSGHDGTYAVKKETHDLAVGIAKAAVREAERNPSAVLASDCPMAARQIERLAQGVDGSQHPISLLRKAYGLS